MIPQARPERADSRENHRRTKSPRSRHREDSRDRRRYRDDSRDRGRSSRSPRSSRRRSRSRERRDDIKVGDIFRGRISNILDYGFFVTLDLPRERSHYRKKEGLVHVSQIRRG